MVKIFIDPGHGGSDPGATAYGLAEKDIVLDIAKYTKKHLQNNYKDVLIKMSRTTDKYLTLAQRTNEANSWGADLFLSIHINAGGGTGYEDYIYSSLSDNSNAGKLQDAIHKEVKSEFTRNRGQKKANFHVLRESAMPAVLTENGFIDSKTDVDILKKDSNLKKIGRAHAKGIAVFLGLSKGSSKKSSGSSNAKGKSISKMATEVIAGKHGSGHANRRKSLGISQSEYEKVRAEVNRRSGVSSTPKPSKPRKTVAQMAKEVIDGKHGNGHEARRKSLGISKSQYDKVRSEVNKRLGGKSKPKGKSISQMATEVIRGDHGQGHANRRKSLGINQATYNKVRAEVNKRL